MVAVGVLHNWMLAPHVHPQRCPSCDHSVRVITRLTQPLPFLGIEALEFPPRTLINDITHDGLNLMTYVTTRYVSTGGVWGRERGLRSEWCIVEGKMW